MPASSQWPTVVSLPCECSSSRPATDGADARGGQPSSGSTLPRPSACRFGRSQAADRLGDVPERVRALVAEGRGVRQLARADGVEHHDEGAPGHAREPIPRLGVRPRVRALEGRAQGAVAEMGVDLGRRHRRVAEQLLHDAQVGAALEQVRREGVAQHVRRDGLLDADRGRVPAHEPEHALAGDAASARVEQECGRLLAACRGTAGRGRGSGERPRPRGGPSARCAGARPCPRRARARARDRGRRGAGRSAPRRAVRRRRAARARRGRAARAASRRGAPRASVACSNESTRGSRLGSRGSGTIARASMGRAPMRPRWRMQRARGRQAPPARRRAPARRARASRRTPRGRPRTRRRSRRRARAGSPAAAPGRRGRRRRCGAMRPARARDA